MFDNKSTLATDNPSVAHKKRILFVTYGGGHAKIILPLVREAHLLGYETLTLALTTARKFLEKEGIRCMNYSDLTEQITAETQAFGCQLAREITVDAYSREETIAYLGLSFADLVARVGLEEAWAQYKKAGRAAFHPVDVLRGVIQKVRPAVVVATNSPRSERAAVDAAAVEGVPSIAIMDLFGSWELEWVKDNRFADRICVLSQTVKDKLVRLGRHPDSVVVTGNPAFDLLAAPELAQAAVELRKEMGLSRKKILLWASGKESVKFPGTDAMGNPELPRLIEAELVRYTAARNDLHLFFRPHPSELDVKYSGLPAHVTVMGQEYSAELMIHLADYFVSVGSTMLLQAAMLGKQSVCVPISITSHLMPLGALGVSLPAHSIQELPRKLDELIDSGWKSNFSIPAPGQATKNVHKVIQELL
jgi:hypothetical protein